MLIGTQRIWPVCRLGSAWDLKVLQWINVTSLCTSYMKITIQVFYRIGHFPFPPGPLIWKWFVMLMRIKLIFTRKVLHLASFWKWGVLELGRGLNYRAVPVIYEKAFKIFAQSCTWNDVYKKARFQDRKIGNTPKFPSMEIYDIRRHCDDTFE